MKKFIIAEHRAKEFANYLWSDMSVYAYALESGARVINRTYLEHTTWGRWLHRLYAFFTDRNTRSGAGVWGLGSPKYLPPTEPLPEKFKKYETLYFFGWLFRNPVGFEKYRKELLAKFAPSAAMQESIDSTLAEFNNKILVGVHLKEVPFRGFENGEFLVSKKRVEEIVDEYIHERGITHEQIAQIVVSDKDADQEKSFYMLSQCSVAIGTNSTFSNLAAWFGNAPHIVTTDEPIDWEYYRGKEHYFENKYATFSYGKTT